MARPAIDISLVGDKALLKQLANLGKPATQKKAVRPALRKSAKRIKPRVVANLSGHPVATRTGRLRAAFAAEKIHGLPRSRVIIGMGFDMPTREALGIDPSDKYYYPVAVEYGHARGAGKAAAPPHPYIRPAVDSNRESELTLIGRDIGKAIEKQAMKK